jgi:hypothetical protein
VLARTPKEIITPINHEIVKAIALPDIQDRPVADGGKRVPTYLVMLGA